jgi:hypothetical protein
MGIETAFLLGVLVGHWLTLWILWRASLMVLKILASMERVADGCSQRYGGKIRLRTKIKETKFHEKLGPLGTAIICDQGGVGVLDKQYCSK